MASFQIKSNSIARIDGKVKMEVKFKDGINETPNWQVWECDSLDDDQIYACLQKSADEWAARPAPDNSIPSLSCGQWMTDPNVV